MASDGLALEQAKQLVLGQWLGTVRRGSATLVGESLEERGPAAFRPADDLVVGALATNVVVGWYRGEDRDSGRGGESLRLARCHRPC